MMINFSIFLNLSNIHFSNKKFNSLPPVNRGNFFLIFSTFLISRRDSSNTQITSILESYLYDFYNFIEANEKHLIKAKPNTTITIWLPNKTQVIIIKHSENCFSFDFVRGYDYNWQDFATTHNIPNTLENGSIEKKLDSKDGIYITGSQHYLCRISSHLMFNEFPYYFNPLNLTNTFFNNYGPRGIKFRMKYLANDRVVDLLEVLIERNFGKESNNYDLFLHSLYYDFRENYLFNDPMLLNEEGVKYEVFIKYCFFLYVSRPKTPRGHLDSDYGKKVRYEEFIILFRSIYSNFQSTTINRLKNNYDSKFLFNYNFYNSFFENCMLINSKGVDHFQILLQLSMFLTYSFTFKNSNKYLIEFPTNYYDNLNQPLEWLIEKPYDNFFIIFGGGKSKLLFNLLYLKCKILTYFINKLVELPNNSKGRKMISDNFLEIIRIYVSSYIWGVSQLERNFNYVKNGLVYKFLQNYRYNKKFLIRRIPCSMDQDSISSFINTDLENRFDDRGYPDYLFDYGVTGFTYFGKNKKGNLSKFHVKNPSVKNLIKSLLLFMSVMGLNWGNSKYLSNSLSFQDSGDERRNVTAKFDLLLNFKDGSKRVLGMKANKPNIFNPTEFEMEVYNIRESLSNRSLKGLFNIFLNFGKNYYFIQPRFIKSSDTRLLANLNLLKSKEVVEDCHFKYKLNNSIIKSVSLVLSNLKINSIDLTFESSFFIESLIYKFLFLFRKYDKGKKELSFDCLRCLIEQVFEIIKLYESRISEGDGIEVLEEIFKSLNYDPIAFYFFVEISLHGVFYNKTLSLDWDRNIEKKGEEVKLLEEWKFLAYKTNCFYLLILKINIIEDFLFIHSKGFGDYNFFKPYYSNFLSQISRDISILSYYESNVKNERVIHFIKVMEELKTLWGSKNDYLASNTFPKEGLNQVDPKFFTPTVERNALIGWFKINSESLELEIEEEETLDYSCLHEDED
uniref:hypothetical protein n=1 Tax=Myxobolus wulii TaxID=649408 RepID=UPI0030012F96